MANRSPFALRDILLGRKHYSHVFNHNMYDAAAAADSAFLYHQDSAEALGNIEEATILIPI